jgi:hypothetical protein
LISIEVPRFSPKRGMYEILIATHNLWVAVTTSIKDPANTNTSLQRLKLVSQRRPSKDFQSHREVAFFCLCATKRASEDAL